MGVKTMGEQSTSSYTLVCFFQEREGNDVVNVEDTKLRLTVANATTAEISQSSEELDVLTLYRPMTAFAVMTQCASNDQ